MKYAPWKPVKTAVMLAGLLTVAAGIVVELHRRARDPYRP